MDGGGEGERGREGEVLCGIFWIMDRNIYNILCLHLFHSHWFFFLIIYVINVELHTHTHRQTFVCVYGEFHWLRSIMKMAPQLLLV